MVTTDGEGAYTAPLILAGRYDLTVEAQGFKKFVRSNIELNVNDRLTVDARLEVGRVEEQVVVETSPLEVELQTATQSGLVTGKEIRELPLNNRNYLQLLTLQPGVSSGSSDQLYVGLTNPSGGTNTVQFAINGLRTSQNSYTIDGADNIDRGSNLSLLNFPSVDAIAEFKVLRNHYSAEYGRNAGGQVNVITRSGGKEFHGGAYEFFRNDVLNAASFFENRNAPRGLDGDGKAIRAPLRYNNFGYTIGGPALIPGPTKDKLFFFFSQEFRRVITSNTFNAQVPRRVSGRGSSRARLCRRDGDALQPGAACRNLDIQPRADKSDGRSLRPEHLQQRAVAERRGNTSSLLRLACSTSVRSWSAWITTSARGWLSPSAS